MNQLNLDAKAVEQFLSNAAAQASTVAVGAKIYPLAVSAKIYPIG